MKISGTVITFNEERHIKKCLDSLSEVADEIVVIDSFSTDATESICKSNDKVRFIQNEFPGHIQQKQLCIEQADHDWILSLDGDECLSDDLIKEISLLKAKQVGDFTAFAMPRLNNYCGRWIRHSGWYPDRKIRFWKKSEGCWGGTNPHDSVIVNQGVTVQMLKGDILHYTIPDLDAHVQQSNKFSRIAARELLKRGPKKFAALKMIFDPPFTFLKHYLFRRGFLDGLPGFTIAVLSAHYTFLKYAKYIHLKSQNENTPS